MKKDTKEIREKLIAVYGTSIDRELFKAIGLTEEQKHAVLDWIVYQNAFAFNSGYDSGIANAVETRDNEKSFNEGHIAGKESIIEEMRILLEKTLK